jgi:hypothetical protein
MEDSLDLSGVQPSGVVEIYPSGPMTALVIGSIVLLVSVIALSVRVALGRPPAARPFVRLSELPGSLQLLAALSLLAILIVQAIAAADVVVQTRVSHESVAEYFQYITWARLLGTSHAHIFGYLVLYGLVALLAAMTAATERLKAFIVATVSWCGLFDVVSWWGMKGLTPRFEWLAMFTGIGTSSASLCALWLVTRELWKGRA